MDTGRVTINILPDEVLLLVFHFDRVVDPDGMSFHYRLDRPSWWWHRLAHVCRRWRSVVFASPNFLDLRLIYGPNTNMNLTGIWPPLPVIIRSMEFLPIPEDQDFDASIVPHNRVYEIELFVTGPEWHQFTLAMEEQFPALIHLRLYYLYIGAGLPAPILPDRLLGESAPRLQSLELHSISFPALPKLLLSATQLVRLDLQYVSHYGYMSPEPFVTGLAVSANLEFLRVEFEPARSRPYRESRPLPPPTRTVLPALTHLELKGVGEWLEDVLLRIDAPLLDSVYITFFRQILLDISPLVLFMRRTAMLEELNEAHVVIGNDSIEVKSLQPIPEFNNRSGLRIACEGMNDQTSSLVQVITSLFPSLYVVEDLYIYGSEKSLKRWRDNTENTQWVEILRPFTAVKNLSVCKEYARCITPALQELEGEKVTDLLPALKNLRLDELEPTGRTQKAIKQFVAARRLLGHPVAVSYWDRGVRPYP